MSQSMWDKVSITKGSAAGSPPADFQAKSSSEPPKVDFDFTGLETSGNSWSTKSSRAYKTNYVASLVSKSLSNVNLTVGVQGLVNTIVTHHYFELVVSFLILANLMVTALEVQYVGCRIGYTLGHEDCASPKGRQDMVWEEVFNYLSVGFTVCFFLEFLLRMLYMGREAARRRWMWFDFFCLVFGCIDTITRLSETNLLLLNPTVMRVARIVRMLRIVKFFRSREVFQTLFLLMKSILASRHTLVWFILILYITVTVIGLLLNQLLVTYLTDGNESVEERRIVYEYFGTYSRMLVTMFEITLGNWPTPTRVLMVHVGQWWGIFVVIYRCVFCFSLVNTTLAVFINETSRVAADDQVQMIHKLRRDKKTADILSELFKEIDSSGDGLITLEELQTASKDKVMVDIMDIHGFDMQDVEELFRLMDKGNGKVPQDRIVHGIMRFGGNAKGSRQLAILRLVRTMDHKLSGLTEELAALKRLR